MTPIYILIVCNLFFCLYIFSLLKKEQKRSRILQAFIAGIVRSVSDYVSSTDDPTEMPKQNMKLPIPYKKIIESIEHELHKDVPMESYGAKWLLERRRLFDDWKSTGDGFTFMNYDLFDHLIELWKQDPHRNDPTDPQGEEGDNR
jgi:hypothetical protein